MQRKSVADHKSNGTFRGDRHARRSDQRVATGKPEKPSWMDDDREASAAWEMIVRNVHPAVLAAVDALTIAGAARWYALWRRFDRQLADGAANDYKLVVESAMAWKNFERAAAKLGITPADRARIQIPPDATRQVPPVASRQRFST